MIRENMIKKQLKEGKNFVGTFVKSSDPSFVEILALCGFDFIIVDNEHTIMNRESLQNIIRTCDATSMIPTVRIREVNDALIRQVLDAGALGVQVPMINTKTDAQAVVDGTKYAPEGTRGYAASQRSAAYGFMDPKEYARISNENTMVACYCETLAAIQNIDEILSVEGIDIIFIGPFDLSQALGVLGEPGHPKVLEAIDMVTEKTRKAGKAVGIIASDAVQAQSWFDKGIQYVCLSSDFALVATLGKRFIKELKD